jgi:predicted protein tyrosine phosphatase
MSVSRRSGWEQRFPKAVIDRKMVALMPKARWMKKVLFVCSQNRLRSPTAEQVFSSRPDLEVASAGTNNDADNPLTSELVAWADVVVVMEKAHRSKVQKRFRSSLNGKRLICLDIPDEFEFMDPTLVKLLQSRLGRYLPSG